RTQDNYVCETVYTFVVLSLRLQKLAWKEMVEFFGVLPGQRFGRIDLLVCQKIKRTLVTQNESEQLCMSIVQSKASPLPNIRSGLRSGGCESVQTRNVFEKCRWIGQLIYTNLMKWRII